MSWTEARVEQLKFCFNEGLSCSQIAAAIGGVTRNSVISKLHRLGLRRIINPRQGRPPAEDRPRRPRPAKARHVVRRRRALNHVEAIEESAAPLPRELPAEAIPVEQRKTLVQLTDATCRWPYGDPTKSGFFFCGAESVEGLPYCLSHCGIAYQPPARERTPAEKEAIRRRVLKSRQRRAA